MSILFIAAVLPVVLLLWFIYKKDKYQPEPLGALLKTFGVGCLSVIPASFMELIIQQVSPAAEVVPVAAGLFNGYVVAGFSEELWKLLLLMWVIWKSPHFDEYFDGIVYAVYLSLGFATVENLMYVFTGGEEGMMVAFSRALTAVPAHFLFAVTMGYYVSLAKFDEHNRRKHLLKALLIPVLLHGTYDAILMVSQNLSAGADESDEIMMVVCGGLIVLFVVFDVFLWRLGMKRIKRLQEHSRTQGFDRKNPFDGFVWNV